MEFGCMDSLRGDRSPCLRHDMTRWGRVFAGSARCWRRRRAEVAATWVWAERRRNPGRTEDNNNDNASAEPNRVNRDPQHRGRGEVELSGSQEEVSPRPRWTGIITARVERRVRRAATLGRLGTGRRGTVPGERNHSTTQWFSTAPLVQARSMVAPPQARMIASSTEYTAVRLSSPPTVRLRDTRPTAPLVG